MPLLAIAEIWRPYLVSEAEEAGLNLNWSQILKTGFLMKWLILTVAQQNLQNGMCAQRGLRSARRNFGSLATHLAPNKDSDQTAQL